MSTAVGINTLIPDIYLCLREYKGDQLWKKQWKKSLHLPNPEDSYIRVPKSTAGLANTWDYGNLGVELKNNVKRAWWKKFIQENPYNVGVDCAILMNPQTWVASGHLGGFSDPLMDCKECHERFRADKIIEDYLCRKRNRSWKEA